MHEPSESLLKKYADVLVKFALNSGRGINEGDVVVAYVPDVAKPLLIQIHKSILEAGGSPIIRMIPTGINRQTYELSNDEQLTFYPAKYHKALVNMMDHQIGILADTDLHELEGVDPAKIMKSLDSSRKTRELIEDKEYKGKFTWTLGLYPTKAMADEAGLTLEQYWQQVIKACFLD